MPIEIKFFAAIREQMGRSGETITGDDVETVADVWARVSGDKPLPANTLVAVNMEYADMSHKVVEGDEVAFFPFVTGG